MKPPPVRPAAMAGPRLQVLEEAVLEVVPVLEEDDNLEPQDPSEDVVAEYEDPFAGTMHPDDPSRFGFDPFAGLSPFEGDGGEEPPAEDAGSPEERVFGMTDRLRYVRDVARARMVSPWALLAVLVTRVVSCTPPGFKVPAFVGSAASLNTFVALVGTSNGGKTIAVAVADEILPPRVAHLAPVLNPSSGEGIVALFVGRDDNGEQVIVRERVMSVLDEISSLGAQQDRSGNTLGSFLRTAWSGATISTYAADPRRQRHLPGHAYRYCLVAGVQYDTADVLLRDEGAGTPQRFWWEEVSDPHAVLDHPEPDANPFAGWTYPGCRAGGEYVGYPEHVRDLVRRARLAAVREDSSDRDSLDGHQLLVRLKIAAGLALLHGDAAGAGGGVTVTEDMWDASGILIGRSARTLRAVLDHDRRRQAAAIAAQGRADAVREDARDRHRTTRLALALARHVHRSPEGVTRSRLRKAAQAKDRDLFDPAIVKAVADGYVDVASRPHPQRDGEVTEVYVPGEVRP